MEKKRYKNGQIIFEEASTGNEMYFILSGKIRVYKTINGEEVLLGRFGQHDFFGELSLLLETERSASATRRIAARRMAAPRIASPRMAAPMVGLPSA